MEPMKWIESFDYSFGFEIQFFYNIVEGVADAGPIRSHQCICANVALQKWIAKGV